MSKHAKDLTDFELAIIENINNILEERQISRYRLSKKTMISEASISAILNGQNSPSMFTLYRIFKGLSISPAEFFQSCFDKQINILTGDEKILLSKWSKLTGARKNMVLSYINGMMAEAEIIKY